MHKVNQKTVKAIPAILASMLSLVLALPVQAQGLSNAELSASSPSVAQLAIIIDDIGNSWQKGLDAIALPGNITFAVMPHRKHSIQLAERAGRLGKEVMLHAPMATMNNRELGAGALHENLGEKLFKLRLRFAIDNIPYVRGINNHMGSRLTTSTNAMGWVMDVLKEKQLFFVDSRTHANSIAFEQAQQYGLASAKRDVFLDHERTLDAVHRQFKLAVTIAKEYGNAIAIGHPHNVTLRYLEHVIPQLEQHHIETIFVSALLKTGNQSRPNTARYNLPKPQPDLDELFARLEKKRNLSLNQNNRKPESTVHN
ncbi:divergent polysaccharide deacetylase family protein [Bermanella marisrubri]|nr:divergent polysaccharide deacetylase family protein [Bermanella marisrubri]QIZ82947.1 divergent polysaccharide deacetylase family protein [Bermanella marisrubri]